jgi:hypothetical protein
MEPEVSVPNSQELSICPYPEPDKSRPQQPKPPLQDLSYYPPSYVLVSLVASFRLAFPPTTYMRASST